MGRNRVHRPTGCSPGVFRCGHPVRTDAESSISSPVAGHGGLVRSVIVLMGLALSTPDYNTLCRRQGTVQVVFCRVACPKGRCM